MSFPISMGDTPRTDAAAKEAMDGTGCICRMEPIWKTMMRMERELASLKSQNETLGKLYAAQSDRVEEMEKDREAYLLLLAAANDSIKDMRERVELHRKAADEMGAMVGACRDNGEEATP